MTMLDLINTTRAAHGIGPVRQSARLDAAALRHAQDMARNPWITAGDSHKGSDQSTIGDRISAAGYPLKHYGEITGWGFEGNEQRMVDWWLQSPHHRPYLLDPAFDEVGIGYVKDANSQWRDYWTVDFGKGDGVVPGPLPSPYMQAIELRREVVALFHGGASAVEHAFADSSLTAASAFALLDLRERLKSLMSGMPMSQ